jgi:hypothetical protein
MLFIIIIVIIVMNNIVCFLLLIITFILFKYLITGHILNYILTHITTIFSIKTALPLDEEQRTIKSLFKRIDERIYEWYDGWIHGDG